MFTKAFWLATLERCARTFAATLLGLGVGDATNTVGGGSDFLDKCQAAGWITLATFLMCLAASKVGTAGPSLGTEVMTPPAPPIQADAPVGGDHLPPPRNEAGAVRGDGRFVLLVAAGVLLALLVWWLIGVLDDGKKGDDAKRHGNDWELAPIGMRA